METKNQLNAIQLPNVCADCMDKLYHLAANETQSQLFHHCPHYDTAIHITVADHEGTRTIIKWMMEAPVTQERFVALAEQLGASLGAEMQVFHSGMVQ